jgi:hypothetical protein
MPSSSLLPVHPTRLVCVFALFFATTFFGPLSRADVAGVASSPAMPATMSAPPCFPDAAQLPEGCFISTLAYLAKFTAAFPEESASSLTIQPKQHVGPHTVALISWRNRWWVRDQHLGVLSLNQTCDRAIGTVALGARAEAALDARARSIAKWKRERIAGSLTPSAAAINALRDVTTAASLLPCTSEQFWVKCGSREIPLLFFRPAPGQVAVYDPTVGTATAESTIACSTRIVEMVAAQLGYKVTSIRAQRTELIAALAR